MFYFTFRKKKIVRHTLKDAITKKKFYLIFAFKEKVIAQSKKKRTYNAKKQFASKKIQNKRIWIGSKV